MQARIPFDPVGVIIEHEQVEGLSEALKKGQSNVVEVIRSIEGDNRSSGGNAIVRLFADGLRQSFLQFVPIPKRALHAQRRTQMRQIQNFEILFHVIHRDFLHQKRTVAKN